MCYIFSVFIIIWIGVLANGFEKNADEHSCRRQCRANESPKLCEYSLTVEWYTTMSRACFYCPSKKEDCWRNGCILGSGTQRPVITANRRLPGPSIEVCKGDRVRVNVYNEMQNGETTAIHWHGIRQRTSQQMDGVPMVTQCPILSRTMFTYEFEADLPGTYFWHAQSGVQRADGLAGALIVREPNDPHASLYDMDELPAVILNDWFPSDSASNRFVTYQYGDADKVPTQILINGQWQPSTTSTPPSGNPPLPEFPVSTASFEFKLNPLARYRFRVISNAIFCSISVTIDGHNLIVIATDGRPVKPQPARSFVIMPGERYDFVPYFTGEYVTSDSVYWLTAVGLADCAVKKAQGLAKISYVAGITPIATCPVMATNNQTSSRADEINSITAKTNWTNSGIERGRMTAILLDAIDDDPKIRQQSPNISFVIEIDFEPINSTKFFPWIGVRGQFVYSPRFNHITNRMPPAPFLTQPDDIPSDLICNQTRRKCSADEFCECIHVLDVPLNALVEIIFVNTGRKYANVPQPIHLHGYTFRLVGMDQLHENFAAEEMIQTDKNGNIMRRLVNAVAKDTVVVSAGGYTIIRFVADNPGAWVLHSTNDFYMEAGMALILRVAPYQQPPRNTFLRCGSWTVLSQQIVTTPAPTTCKPNSSNKKLVITSNNFLNITTAMIVTIMIMTALMTR